MFIFLKKFFFHYFSNNINIVALINIYCYTTDSNYYYFYTYLPIKQLYQIMGVCMSAEQREEKEKSQRIDRELEEDNKRLRRECKILLLGIILQ